MSEVKIRICCIWMSLITIVASQNGIVEDTEGLWLDYINKWNDDLEKDKPDFELDTAWLSVKNLLPSTVHFYWQHSECYGCQLLYQVHVEPNSSEVLLTQSKYPNHMALSRDEAGNDVICGERDMRLRERGDYWLVISGSDPDQMISCTLTLANDPENYYLPILWAFLLFLGLAVLWVILKQLYTRRYFHKLRCNYGSEDLSTTGITNTSLPLENRSSVSSVQTWISDETFKVKECDDDMDTIRRAKTTLTPEEQTMKTAQGKKRLRSLDTFRGISLLIMIFVNYGGGGYYFFEHAIWNGILVADLVFPWFVFIMGTSMAFSFRGMAKRNTPVWQVLWKITTRTVWLFGIGIFLATKHNNDMTEVRIPGVLQRFSITYLITALVHYPFARADDPYKDRRWSPIRDIVQYWPEWIIMLALLSLQIALTFALPVPDCPTGYIGPGGLHDGGDTFNCTGGAAGYIDRLILTEDHIFKFNVFNDVYLSTQAFDPEGILGSLTSIFMCFLGLQAGKILLIFPSHACRNVRWLIWAVITGAIALVLTKASLNDGWVPLNKHLWSVSFILALSSMAYILLCLLYVIVDQFDLYTGAPFFYPGMNSIVIYTCHSVFSGYFPVSWQTSDPTLHSQRLYMALWGTCVWIFLAYILYRKHIFVAL